MAHDCIEFRGRIAWQRFLVNNFADFPDVVQVKKSRFRSVIGGVFLQQHPLLVAYAREKGCEDWSLLHLNLWVSLNSYTEE